MLSARLVVLACVCCLVQVPAAVAQGRDDFFGRDKALHFGVSALLCVTTYAITLSWGADEPARVGFSLGVPLSLGFAKELYDDARGGHASHGDLTWDFAGTISGFALASLVHHALRPEHATFQLSPRPASRSLTAAPVALHAPGLRRPTISSSR